MKIEEILKENSAVAQVLIEYEKIYGLKKAREMFDYLIEQLVKIFKSYARSLVPEELVEEDIVPSSLRGTLYPPKKPNGYFEGWDKCREEMLRRIEEAKDV